MQANKSVSYPLLPNYYALVISYWRTQIAAGRVKLGKIEAMQELLEAGAQAKGIAVPQEKRRPAKHQAASQSAAQ